MVNDDTRHDWMLSRKQEISAGAELVALCDLSQTRMNWYNQHLQARAQVIQTAISCVQGAANHEAMHACREQEHQQLEKLRPRR